MRFADQGRMGLAWCAAFLAAAAVFLLWPGIDLAVAALFYVPGEGFPLSRSVMLEWLRQAVWTMSILMVALAVAATLAALIGRPFRFLDLRQGVFILALYLLGPSLLADGILKRFWGRARPDTVEAFGGTQHFTPPLLPADQCASNCSFVSGEGAAATALAISFVILAPAVRSAVPVWVYRLYVGFAVAAPLAGMGLRVAFGRHFLSDTLFAALFVSGIALILHRLLLAAHPRPGPC